jgi:glycosyltransferase involved in cell wall biosynthesis
MKKEKKVLFILRKKQTSHSGYSSVSSGLLNSAKFVSDMLNKNGIESHLVEVNDNNCIDREVTRYKPTHVVIEALWIVPSKFEVLTRLHPHVQWIIRLHSDISFLANEGIAMQWIYEYMNYPNVKVSANDFETNENFKMLTGSNFVYLPNYYPVGFFNKNKPKTKCKKTINVGCFGAIRPLKNQLIQAVAAIDYADTYNKKLRFHINVKRVEGKGEPVLKNLRELFNNNPKHELVEYNWLDHDDFIDLVQSMDLGMQVSFTETFNIVTADFVNNNIPVVVSKEVSWVNPLFFANPSKVDSIFTKMKLALSLSNIKILNKIGLWWYSLKSEKIWTKYFG